MKASPAQNCTGAACESCVELSLQFWVGLSRLLARTAPIIRLAPGRAMRQWRRMRAFKISALAWARHMPAAGSGCLLLRIQFRVALATRCTGVFGRVTRFASRSGPAGRSAGCGFACRGQRFNQPSRQRSAELDCYARRLMIQK